MFGLPVSDKPRLSHSKKKFASPHLLLPSRRVAWSPKGTSHTFPAASAVVPEAEVGLTQTPTPTPTCEGAVGPTPCSTMPPTATSGSNATTAPPQSNLACSKLVDAFSPGTKTGAGEQVLTANTGGHDESITATTPGSCLENDCEFPIECSFPTPYPYTNKHDVEISLEN
jgi:hypothetical protein